MKFITNFLYTNSQLNELKKGPNLSLTLQYNLQVIQFQPIDVDSN